MEQNGTENALSLTPRQQAALPQLAATPSTAQGAKHAQVGRTTLHRWMHDPRFRTELTRLRTEAAALAYVELQGILPQAVAVLADALDHSDPHVRLPAVRVALSMALKAAELREFQQRLDRLEDALALRKAPSRNRNEVK